jgi:hypothetical protein
VSAAAQLRRVRRGARIARQIDLPAVRGALWAVPALRRLRRDLPRVGLEAHVAAPRGIESGGLKGVVLVNRIGHATCLERSLVLQAWHLGQGTSYDVLVGVDLAQGAIDAHAWVGGYEPARSDLTVIARLPGRRAGTEPVASRPNGE